MSFLRSLETSATGMTVQRRRMDIIASNLANIETTRTESGLPYRRKMVVMGTKKFKPSFQESLAAAHIKGARIEGVVEDSSPFKRVHSPGHPDADKDGFVQKPNIDVIVESTNMIMARRAFEANLAAVKTTRQMVLKALEIGR